MPPPISFGSIQFNLGTAVAGAKRSDDDTPFNVLILADLSGRASRGQGEPIAPRRVRPVDIDNFDQVLRDTAPRVTVPDPFSPNQPLEINVASLDDFHPDQLLARIGSLAVLLRQRSERPSAPGPTRPPEPTEATTQPSAESHADTLARLMGGGPPPRPAPAPTAPSPAGFDVQKLVRSLVTPSVVQDTSAEQAAVCSAVDLDLTRHLQTLLHHPRFQALEAAWRGVDLLVRAFGAEENLMLAVADVSRDELLADLNGTEHLAGTGLAQLLGRGLQGQPWALAICGLTFGETVPDLQALGRLARVAAATGTACIAGASPRLVGCTSFAAQPDPADWHDLNAELDAAWTTVRRLPEAEYVGLALPRFLLRQPYGHASDPINSFPFEELGATPDSEGYLWGPPAILCGHVLAEAFVAEGWAMASSRRGELGGLPVHRPTAAGAGAVTPCAEAWLSERAAETIAARGLMPILSVRGRDAARLEGVRSIREPAAALAGRWTG